MITVYHQRDKIVNIISQNGDVLFFNISGTIAGNLFSLAKKYPTENITWCNIDFKDYLNYSQLEFLLENKKAILSFGNATFLSKKIGYIDESPFININRNIRYPTWLMCTDVGVISCEVLNLVQDNFNQNDDFEYTLNSLAKIGMSQGLLCYSEPKLFTGLPPVTWKKNRSHFSLFKFTRQHYKFRWLFLLMLNLLIYEFKFPVLPMLFSIFYSKRNSAKINFNYDLSGDIIQVQKDYDVLIPTIGRKTYLYEFLKDLNAQTILPKNVIVIEQNPAANSVSELDYLTSETWNFNINHIFTNQAGACNARNAGIVETESFWTFLADDDVSVEADFSEKVFVKLAETKTNAATINCHLKNEKQKYFNIMQWQTFGTCSSFVKTSELQKCLFLKGYEFGFGEDADFGMQLRNLGNDVLYFPSPKILHHKAPIGGFRIKPVLAWANEIIPPKPSPTIMLYQMSHNTKEQILGYKVILFFKYYRHQKIRNPIKYFLYFKKQWRISVYWANKLKSATW